MRRLWHRLTGCRVRDVDAIGPCIVRCRICLRYHRVPKDLLS